MTCVVDQDFVQPSGASQIDMLNSSKQQLQTDETTSV